MPQTIKIETERLLGLARKRIESNSQENFYHQTDARFDLPGPNLSSYPVATFFCAEPREFLFRCYSALLRRSPDPQGLSSGLMELMHGTPPIELLWRIRHSAEGQQQGVKVIGLRASRVAHHFLHIRPLAALGRAMGLLPRKTNASP